jgi:N-acetyl-1-D-myo-inositol-2-amino-2-deoxy-alpha-D-glucopyranoside deacetylase
MPSQRRLLLVHAHPDDETINNGATMAFYANSGAHVTLVTCTRGEEGEVLVPELEHLASSREDRLGAHRIEELAAAMRELGVRDHRFLGAPDVQWRDSGMMGTPANERPDSFWQADLDQAAGLLAEVIVEIKPQVLVTYDDFGGYGHPDHIQAHRVAMRAVELAQPEWQVSKIYWNTMPRSVIEAGMEAMRASGAAFDQWGSIDEMPFVKPDESVTTVVDAGGFVEAKVAALRAHATQITTDGPFFALSNNLGLSVFAREYYTLVRGTLGPDRDSDGREVDLFSGVGA